MAHQQIRITGAKKFNDAIDGKTYDFTKVKLEMQMVENVNSMGCDTTDWIPVGNSSVMLEWQKQGITLPALADVEMGVALKKGVPTLEIHSIQFLVSPKVK